MRKAAVCDSFRGAILAMMVTVLALPGCGSGGTASPRALTFEYDFTKEEYGWTGDFADLPVDYDKDTFRLSFSYADSPQFGGVSRKALRLSGNNASDDLFMFLKKKLTAADGIVPGARYHVTFDVSFATSAPAGAVGIGGAPGESVIMKAGASNIEPVPVAGNGANAIYRLSVDKGNQNNDGESALRIGNIAKPVSTDFETWEVKTLSTATPLEATSDADGTLWLFVGTDSGFEGETVLYYTHVRVSLVPV